MRETDDDLARLRGLLEQTYARAGDHLRAIHLPATRVDPARLVRELDGMRVLVVATVTADGRPLTGPVDGWFYRGRWHFGTSPSSVRARHLARRPAVSATYADGERFVCTVHGTAQEVDLATYDGGGFSHVLRDFYGQGWLNEVGSGAPYWAIEADRLLAADVSVLAAGAG
ncbi:pyridoxamine 5'-phosphate oxidase family protein [Egicoccus sp. AB-alg2]|uniref:pyridoxamine 5'-phosphate oxidase family protein n=1 Tax=Egicoccus sp. AB-alg2 TaxID=3242693 RepID=UPI00359CE508